MKKLIITCATACLLASQSAAQSADGDDMRSLTNGILASLNGTPAQTASSARGADAATLQGIIQQAHSEGQSDDYLQSLLSEAEANGQIEVSDAMRTTEGRIDAHILLQRSQRSPGASGHPMTSQR